MPRMQQKSLFSDYDGFVEKFKPKKTTDDCHTPENVYEAVKGWACAEYGIDPAGIVRPFWPGGDYRALDYPEGCTVLDNPPFSILTEICGFYLECGIPFFLFAPSLTCLAGRSVAMRMNHIVCDCSVTYANGAEVPTSFVTSYGFPEVYRTAPGLTRAVNEANERNVKAGKAEIPRYTYPDHVLTAAMGQRYARHGIELRVRADECCLVSALDAQRGAGKSIFGGGLLLSDEKAAERSAAERSAAHRWELSDRERAEVAMISRRAPCPPGRGA